MDYKDFIYCHDYDDGKILSDLNDADVILLGPSRVGKTPLSFYMGYFDLKVCNIPLVPEANLTEMLKSLPREKTFGLTRSVESIRKHRLSREENLGISSNYASEERIFDELMYAHDIYKTLRIPIIDLDKMAIEEATVFISKRISR